METRFINMVRNFLILVVTLLVNLTFAQDYSYLWKREILKQTGGNRVIRWEEPHDRINVWFVVVQVKNKQGYYQLDLEKDYDMHGDDSSSVRGVYEIIPPKYSEIDEFFWVDEEVLRCNDNLAGEQVAVAEASRKGKKTLVVRTGIDDDFSFAVGTEFFDEIEWGSHITLTVPVSQKDKWGIYSWAEHELLIDCEYSSIRELPTSTDPCHFSKYSLSVIKAFNKNGKWGEMDMIDLDGGNGDGLFKARNAETKKWGIFQHLDGHDFVEAVPMKYDSLYHFGWNADFTPVFNNGKVGFYLSYWTYDEKAKQTVPCTYDDFKLYVPEDRITRLAVKRNGKWGWVDWLTGEEKSEFIYDSVEDLPYPDYKQQIWLD